MPSVERIERYELLGELATGGMATVYLGRQHGPLGFARTVAIKSMHAQFAKDEDFRAMFLDEATLTARIRHPNVVPTLDIVDASSKLLLVMEYVDGISLAELMREAHKRSSAISPAIAVAIMSDVLHGLHAAHELRDETGRHLEVIHRDVSPQNVLVGSDGVARILDFGIAKATTRRYKTATDEIKGKLAYMSPQALYGDPLDRRADVYAAGVVLWEMLAGERLFAARSDAEMMHKVVEATIVPPGFVAAGAIPRELDDAVMQAISRDADVRFPNAEAMAGALVAAATPASRGEIAALVNDYGQKQLASRAALLREGVSVDLEPDARIVADLLTAQATMTGAPSVRARTAATRRSVSMFAGAFAIVALVIGAFFVGLRSSRSAASARAAQRAEAPKASSASLAPPPPSAPASVATIAEPPPHVAALAAMSANTVPARASTRKPAPPVPPPPPSTVKRPRPNVDCSVPYTVDALGDRHFRPECVP